MCRCTIHLLRNFCLYHAVVLKLKSAVTRSVKVKYVGVFRLWNGFSLSSVFTIGILMTSCKLRKIKFSFHQKGMITEFFYHISRKYLTLFHVWHYRCKMIWIILVQHSEYTLGDAGYFLEWNSWKLSLKSASMT